MSIVRCEKCGKNIDLDYEDSAFIFVKSGESYICSNCSEETEELK
jgi:DNA-directed RNA polymerase subunit RPC12/RpoP